MINRALIPLLLILASAGSRAAPPTVTFELDMEEKNIQLDGFLVEWSKADAAVLTADSAIVVDVKRTQEGIAGYFRAHLEDTCVPYRFSFYPVSSPHQWNQTIRLDTSEIHSDSSHSWYAIFTGESASGKVVVAEWLVQTATVSGDSSGDYGLGIVAGNPCTDTLALVTISVPQESSSDDPGIWTPRLIMQVILIGILLVSFLFLRAHAKRLKSRSQG